MLFTSAEAAHRLGVSTRQVQRLVAGGVLHSIGPDRLDALSVERHTSRSHGCHRRVWAEATAWGAISLVEGHEPAWLGQSQRSRLKARLRGMSASELAAQARERARVRHFQAHPAALRHLQDTLLFSRRNEEIAGLTASTTGLDGYLCFEALDGVIARYGLDVDVSGALTIRTTTMPLADVGPLIAGDALVVAGLDLAESLDVRERSAGIALLERALNA